VAAIIPQPILDVKTKADESMEDSYE
jgi:hypothetical protein